MSWRTIATVFIIVFAIAIGQGLLAGPILEVADGLNGSGDYENEHFDGNQLIADLPGQWFNMGLLAMVGIMLWGAFRVLREELTRGRL
jgi:hypothetical protein